MAAIQALTAQAINVTTKSPHATLRTVCQIDASNFTANATYLILVSAFARQASSANETILKLTHGGTLFDDGQLAYEQVANTQKASYGWMYVFTQPGTPENVLLEMASSDTQVVTVEWAGIVAINLDDVGTDGTEYHYDAVTANMNINTASVFDGAAVTFTPSGSDDWLLIANGVISGVSATTNHKMFLNDSVAGDLVTVDVEGEDATNDIKGYLLMTVVTPSNASHTFKAAFQRESTAFTVESSRILALNLSAFAQHAFSSASAQDTPAATPSWTTTRTIAPTPDTTGNWLLWGYFSDDVGVETDDLYTRLQINPDGSGLASDPAYADNSPGTDGWDASDITPVNIFRLRSLTSGAARTVNLDVQMNSGTSSRVQERTLVGFALETPGAGGASSGPLLGAATAAASVTATSGAYGQISASAATGAAVRAAAGAIESGPLDASATTAASVTATSKAYGQVAASAASAVSTAARGDAYGVVSAGAVGGAAVSASSSAPAGQSGPLDASATATASVTATTRAYGRVSAGAATASSSTATSRAYGVTSAGATSTVSVIATTLRDSPGDITSVVSLPHTVRAVETHRHTVTHALTRPMTVVATEGTP